jgi:FMN phosphatase YigB (HAD superfamily)
LNLAPEPDRDLLASAKLVTVDVFDTVLHRKPLSESRRLRQAMAAAMQDPVFRDSRVHVDALVWARTRARRFGYRALSVAGSLADLSLDEMARHTVRVLGLPEGADEALVAAELAVEAASVRPNLVLTGLLRSLRADGRRVVALSDTWYSCEQLGQLLAHYGCQDALDHVYSSSELGGTKYSGAAFEIVARREGVALCDIVHVGDHPHADGEAPRELGVSAVVVPREPLYRGRLLADGLAHTTRVCGSVLGPYRRRATGEAFTDDVFGPIVAEYALSMWLYLASLTETAAVALFCARGGLRQQLAYRTVVDRLGLPETVPTRKFMVSRLAAARGGLLRASSDTYAEIAREFAGESCAAVARAFVPTPLPLSGSWDVPFSDHAFPQLLEHDPAGGAVRAAIAVQHALFERHLREVAGRATRLLLCDTGLYGSTQRLLEAGLPEFRWESVLLGRANYKHMDSSHFARTTGLLVEQDAYNPLIPQSALLRYWQLVESLFEPDLSSVRTFHEDDRGAVRSNLEQPGWEDKLSPADDTRFAAVMHYLEGLRPGDAGRVLAESTAAWRTLHRTIVFPSQEQASLLTLADRSRDFGHDQRVRVLPTNRRLSPTSLRGSMWKEGLIALQAGALRRPALWALEAAYAVRGVRSTRSSLEQLRLQ